MGFSRRHFLAASAAFGASLAARADLLPPPQGRRAVIVGGGWAGLAAARTLAQIARNMEVVLLEKQATFWSNPLSNKWLVDLIDGHRLTHDIGAAARTFGYAFLQTEVSAVDREQRRVVTPRGSLGYDWLILAAGIRHDYRPWFGDDQGSATLCRQRFPAAFTDAAEALALKKKLRAFQGGDLVMTVPPAPYRCPPAPYERAGMIAWYLQKRGIKGRLYVLDPNPAVLGFDRIFKDLYRDSITYLPQARIVALDPYRQVITTDFDTIPFADAILMPPQQAGDLLWQASLIGHDGGGRPTGWAAIDPVHLHAPGDERVFPVGDALDRASVLFGHYPKTGQMAARQGQIVAYAIAARSQDREPERTLPESLCYVTAKVEPPELMRLETHYRFRGDGVIQQTVKQSYNAQPQRDDETWAQGMFEALLAPSI